MEYQVIRDTREKDNKGWFWKQQDKCLGMLNEALKTGDYTLAGYEDIVCIERKASPEELAINLGKEYTRFTKEVKRMQDIKHSFIICEFPLSDLIRFPEGSRIPDNKRHQVKITGKYMLKCLTEYQMRYGVHVIFCDDKTNAFIVANGIFKRVLESYGT